MKKGDKVLVVFDNSRMWPIEAHIIKIGFKYITVDNMPSKHARFDINTHVSVDDTQGYNIKAKLYCSQEAYNEEVEEKKLHTVLYEEVKSLLRWANTAQLMAVKNYLQDETN